MLSTKINNLEERCTKKNSNDLLGKPTILTFPLPHENPRLLKEIFKDRNRILTIAGYGYGFSLLENSEVIAIDNCPMQITENLIIKNMCINLKREEMIEVLEQLSKRKKIDERIFKKILKEVPELFITHFEELAKMLHLYFYGILHKKSKNIIDFFPFLGDEISFNKIKNAIRSGKLGIILGNIPKDLKLFENENIDGFYLSNIADHISFEERKKLCEFIGNKKNSVVAFAQIAFPTEYGKRNFISEMELLFKKNGFVNCESFTEISSILETEIKYTILNK